MSYGPFTIAIDNAGRGPFEVRRNPGRQAYPMTHGDAGTGDSWTIEGPAHVAQHFYEERVAIGFCAVLNALYKQQQFSEL